MQIPREWADLATVRAALEGPAGPMWRAQIGMWVSLLVPVEHLVPDSAARWRPLVRDAFQFVFERLSAPRLATKVVQQLELPETTAPEERLLRLVNKMPGLQKVGQVLARNPRLLPRLRQALSELENGMSDVTAAEVRALLHARLGRRLAKYAVKINHRILSEASVSAVIGFEWNRPDREHERGVFKVLKPYVPECFAEDITLLQSLGEFLTEGERGYGFAIHDVKDMLAEVLLLLEHELDFGREQTRLGEAAEMYRASIGIRVPRLIPELCTPDVTAMTAEEGVKVTEAFPRSPGRRARVASQLIEALVAVPFFSRQENAIFHADPHAGNLLYDEVNRELIVLDWALAETLTLHDRRHLVLLSVMMTLRHRENVRASILELARGPRKANAEIIDRAVNRFFDQLPARAWPGTLDAMRLLDRIALEGVSFPPPLFLFRKIVLTLDGVLYDVAGPGVQIDEVIAREFLTRCVASVGLFHSPLELSDFVTIPWNAMMAPLRMAFA